MRWFAFSLFVLGTAVVGCAPPEEIATEPSVPKVSSGTTVEGAATTGGTATPVPTGANSTAPSTPAPAATDAPATPAAEPPKSESSSNQPAPVVRFVANMSVKVPTMSCPFSCWPKVKETLAAQPGVEAVQLAVQAKEDAIDNPVVELKTTNQFDAKAAVEALAKVSFSGAEVVN